MLYLIRPQKYINKTKDQLWDDDHKAFFWWIISLAISLGVILILGIVGITLFSIDRENILEAYRKFFENSSEVPAEIERAAQSRTNLGLGQQIINTALFGAAFGSLIFSFVKSIQNKSFATLSYFPTAIIFILTVFNFISLVNLAFIGISFNDQLKISNFYVLDFVVRFIYFLVWFFSSRNVAIIRRLFQRAENIEQLKQLQENFGAQAGQSGPFGFNFNDAQQQQQGQQQGANQSQQANKGPATMNEDPIYQRLVALDKKQLDKIAKQLSISGYENMEQEELLKTIYSIYKATQPVSEKPNQEIEVQLDPKDEQLPKQDPDATGNAEDQQHKS